MVKRRKTRTVKVGNVKIGSGNVISIQSMAKTDTSDVRSTVQQIHELENVGCEIIRVAVKDLEDAKAIQQIKEEIAIPLVADIHFDYKLAIESIKSGADKIRINPGNIHKFADIDKIIDEASSAKVPIRIGVNSGSLKESQRTSGDIADKMVSFALKYIDHFKKRNFNDLVISLKASEVPATVKAYRKIAEKCDYPLHLGITAAGLPDDGIVKSSIGLGMLIMSGIGDTVRVSLTGNPMFEVDAAKRILTFVGARHFGPKIVACPTCGRCQVDLVPIVEELEDELKNVIKRKVAKEEKQHLIAVMGCEVNGPGEAKDADIGVAFGRDKGVIFSHGKAVKTIKADSAIRELLKIIKKEI